MKKSVLIIEDNEMILTILKRVFSEWEVYAVSSAENISGLLMEVGLVISDFDVPGYQFSEMKDSCALLGIPLVLQTGRLEKIHTFQVAKPYTKAQLMEVVGQAISESIRKKQTAA